MGGQRNEVAFSRSGSHTPRATTPPVNSPRAPSPRAVSPRAQGRARDTGPPSPSGGNDSARDFRAANWQSLMDIHYLQRQAMPMRDPETNPREQFETTFQAQYRYPLSRGNPDGAGGKRGQWADAPSWATPSGKRQLRNTQIEVPAPSFVIYQTTATTDPSTRDPRYPVVPYQFSKPRARTASPSRGGRMTAEQKHTTWQHTAIPRPTILKWQANTRKGLPDEGMALDWADPDPKHFDYRSPREIAASRALEIKEKRCCSSDLKQFREQMFRKYGNLVRAFRLGLDRDKSGIVTKSEFGPNVRAEGYGGNLRRLWSELDTDSTGRLRIHEWAPEDAKLLKAFQNHLVGNYETAETAWRDMCKYKQTYLKLSHFVEACRHIGFDGDAVLLHSLLCGDPGASKFVVHRDILWVGTMDFGDDPPESDDET